MAGHQISVQGQRKGRVGEYGQFKAAHGKKGEDKDQERKGAI